MAASEKGFNIPILAAPQASERGRHVAAKADHHPGAEIYTAILGVALAYARFAIDYTWGNEPHLAVDEQLTAAQFNARAWSERLMEASRVLDAAGLPPRPLPDGEGNDE